MPEPLFTPRKDLVPVVQKAGWAPGPVWTGAENVIMRPQIISHMCICIHIVPVSEVILFNVVFSMFKGG